VVIKQKNRFKIILFFFLKIYFFSIFLFNFKTEAEIELRTMILLDEEDLTPFWKKKLTKE
jgi:hypothetical protein